MQSSIGTTTLHYRPKYYAPFHDVPWDYHLSHSDRWILAHDIGTGPGTVSKVLAKHSDQVVATDPSENHTAVARKFCAEENISIERCQAEDLANAIGRDSHGKVDLITIA